VWRHHRATGKVRQLDGLADGIADPVRANEEPAGLQAVQAVVALSVVIQQLPSMIASKQLLVVTQLLTGPPEPIVVQRILHCLMVAR